MLRAIENGIGINRRSYLLKQFCLNPSKDKNIDSIVNQCARVADLLIKYKANYCLLDESGVGKSSKGYILQELENRGYYKLGEEDIFDIVFTPKTRSELLTNYHNRINSGLNLYPKFDRNLLKNDELKYTYINSFGINDSNSMFIRFLYEHAEFMMSTIEDKNGQRKTMFKQSEYSFIHDDTIMAGALNDYILELKPDICVSENYKTGGNKKNKYTSRNFGGNRLRR
jgi:hypothetical protein